MTVDKFIFERMVSANFTDPFSLALLCVQVTLDVPYASPPHGTKYFTVIGPHIDCMDEQYLVSMILKCGGTFLIRPPVSRRVVKVISGDPQASELTS